MRLTLLLPIFFVTYVVATDVSNPENRQNMFGFGGFGFIFGQGNVLPFTPTFTQECNRTEYYPFTTTTTLYSTVTVSCTKSTNVACVGGRRRRGILLDGGYEEQFPLSPSAVQGVEATIVPIQEIRYVDPKMTEISLESQSQEIESTLQSGSFTDRKVPLPYVGSERNIGSADNRAVITLTPSTTITQFYTITTTWTPICSQWSPITQCPAQAG